MKEHNGTDVGMDNSHWVNDKEKSRDCLESLQEYIRFPYDAYFLCTNHLSAITVLTMSNFHIAALLHK